MAPKDRAYNIITGSVAQASCECSPLHRDSSCDDPHFGKAIKDMLREDSQLEQKQFELYKQLRTLKSTLLNDITRKCTKLMDTLLVL